MIHQRVLNGRILTTLDCIYTEVILLLGELSQSTMSSTQDLLPHVYLGSTFGAVFIGAVLAAM